MELFTKERNESMLVGRTIKKCVSTSSISEYGKFIPAYLKLIVSHDLPILFIESSHFRLISKLKESISTPQIAIVRIKLQKLVYKRVSREVESNIVAVMHDSLSHSYIINTEIIPSYCCQSTIINEQKPK